MCPSKAQVIIDGGPGNNCIGCVISECDLIPRILETRHDLAEFQILRRSGEEFGCYRSWLVGDQNSGCQQPNASFPSFFHRTVLPAMMGMAEELSAVAMLQVYSIGKFIDAENQMETQRRFQELQFEAHKDYQPSEDFCRFGTSTRSMAASEQKSLVNKAAMGNAQMARQLAQSGTIGAPSANADIASRWTIFQENHCDPRDGNWSGSDTGLFHACGNTNTPPAPRRTNIDIDYTRLIEQNRTLDIDMTNSNQPSNDEIDITAMSNNLYAHDILTRQLTKNALNTEAGRLEYFQLRSVAARRSVAQNAFSSITALKASGSNDMEYDPQNPDPDKPQTAKYLYEILGELGIETTRANQNEPSDAEIMIGANPSYYAQLEILSKRLYQNSDFFADLYDKPANVQRKSTALKAVDLMLDRAVFESELRQEMILSVLLATRQNQKFKEIRAAIGKTKKGTGSGQ